MVRRLSKLRKASDVYVPLQFTSSRQSLPCAVILLTMGLLALKMPALETQTALFGKDMSVCAFKS